MVPTNDFQAFATGVGANVESQATYLANPDLPLGNQPGVADAAFVNKSLRQACWIAATLAQFIVNSTGNSVLDDANETTLLANMALTWPGGTLPTQTILTTTGTATGYLFTVSSANATVGATYTNNTNTYTVLQTLASGTQLFCSQAAAPTSSGTLTKASGTGDSTITFSATQALATYTPPANTKYLKTRLVGGGGGGGGGGAGGGTGGVGKPTAFLAGTMLMIGQGGGAGALSANGGIGGNASLGTGPSGIALGGGSGGGPAQTGASSAGFGAAGNGGSSFFGGAGGANFNSIGTASINGAANTGSGGGGGSGNNTTTSVGGSGGGSGGYVDGLISAIASSYYYTIGTGGTAGTAGAGSAGGSGAAGLIMIDEHYTG